MTINGARQFPPALWAMTLAVWALLVLGGAPWPGADATCAQGPVQPARHDCLACPVCCIVQQSVMLVSSADAPAAPRGGQLGVEATDAIPPVVPSSRTTGWARAPPAVA